MAALRHAFSAALLLAPLLVPGPVLAAPLTDLAALDTAVAAFTGQQIGVPGGAAQPVDRRLRLAACSAPLSLSWYGKAQTSVLVRCPDVGGWRVFVPVSAPPAAAAAAPAVIAVARGEGVTVTAVGEGFSVSQPGEALEAGAVGAWIRVRTAAKANPLRARVVRPGLVEMPVD